LGYGVCAIEGEGCPAGQDCFCQCRSIPCAYWVYSHRRPDGSWAISGVGASGWEVHDGDVDGWVWGDGSTAPPIVTFEQICPQDADSPVAPTVVSEIPHSAVTSAPSPSPIVSTAASPSQAEAHAGASGLLGYVVFGVVALGLVGWLVVAGTHGKRI
jgi:hypothetical protein